MLKNKKVAFFFAFFAGVSSSLFANYMTEITVAQDSTGDFLTIQQAIDATKAFPDLPIRIFVKNGLYKEKVRVYAWNDHLTISGESAESTIIEWGDHFQSINLGRNSTFHTYTFQIEANDVTIENLSIVNTAGSIGQAVALHVDGDRVIIKNCNIEGNQDTVYATGEGFRQLFLNCHIEGTTDFIFGSATAVFKNCTIHSKSNSYITAASTTESSPFGFVFLECQLTGDEGLTNVYLGRPWRPFAKTAFINCEMGKHIVVQGWSAWLSNDTIINVRYAEYCSNGDGANAKGRVKWSKQLTKKEASKYTYERIFRGWNPLLITNN
jgi:pectinesterase